MFAHHTIEHSLVSNFGYGLLVLILLVCLVLYALMREENE